MRRRSHSGIGPRLLTASLLGLTLGAACSQGEKGSEGAAVQEERGSIVHRAKGSGSWFPGNGRQLDADVKRYLQEAKVPPVEGRIVAAIAPHAGYQYSGAVAGYAFRAVADRAAAGDKPDVVVILGFSHRASFRGVALMEGDGIETPLGVAPLDTEAGQQLTNLSSRLFFRYALHGNEHSAENEIPFVQAALPGVKMVVGVFGEHDPRDLRTVTELAQALHELAKTRKVLVVASTDMRHHADWELVGKTDRATLKAIEAMDEVATVRQYLENEAVCGILPVLTAMRFAALQGCRKALTLRYRNSGDDHPESRGTWVVGYGAIVFPVEDKGK